MQFSGDYQNLNVKKALDLRTVIVAVNFGHHCGLLTSKIWRVINTYLLEVDIHKEGLDISLVKHLLEASKKVTELTII